MAKLPHTLSICALIIVGAASAEAVQYPTLDSAYVQQIYTGPLPSGPGMAWTSSGHLLTRGGSTIYEYSASANQVHQGTSVHGYTAHTITGLSSTGYGMTNGHDGYIYTATATGLERFNPSNWAAPAQSLAGTVGGQGYGINVLPNGNIVYVAGGGTNEVYMYNPTTTTNTLLYTNPSLIDDIASDGAGYIVLAGQAVSNLVIIDNLGNFVNSYSTAHFPDGLAFGDGVNTNCVFSNNNDGTVTRYQFGAGYTGLPTVTDIAGVSGAYGDLAEVGPDCAFYVSQFDNGGYHGCVPGVATNWDNGVTNNEASITRIALKDGSCGFYHGFQPVPEPASVLGIGGGLLALLRVRRRSRR